MQIFKSYVRKKGDGRAGNEIKLAEEIMNNVARTGGRGGGRNKMKTNNTLVCARPHVRRQTRCACVCDIFYLVTD